MILAIRNKFYFESIRNFMLKNSYVMCEDLTRTVWHIDDIESILVNSFGYHRAANGQGIY